MWFYAEKLRSNAYGSVQFSGFCEILMRTPTNHCSISSIKLFMAVIINTYSFKCQLIFNNWEENEKPFHPVGACSINHMQSGHARCSQQNATTCFQFFFAASLFLSLFPMNHWKLRMPHPPQCNSESISPQNHIQINKFSPINKYIGAHEYYVRMRVRAFMCSKLICGYYSNPNSQLNAISDFRI